jgi:general secretion pathway protein G
MLKHLKSREDWNEKSFGAKGFTLIELLVVIIILGILAGVAVFAIGGITTKSHTNACKNEKYTVVNAIEAYKLTNTSQTPSTSDLTNATTGTLKTEPKYWQVAAGVISRNPATTSDVSASDCS